MQKWEYKEVVFGYHDGRIEKVIEDSQEYRLKEKNPNLVALLNSYGSQGWELVAKMEYNCYIFKRPL